MMSCRRVGATYPGCLTNRAAPRLRPHHHCVAELAQRLVLDLADALAREADLLADLLERHRVLAVEAVAELEDLGGALVDFIEQALELPVNREVLRLVGTESADRFARTVAQVEPIVRAVERTPPRFDAAPPTAPFPVRASSADA